MLLITTGNNKYILTDKIKVYIILSYYENLEWLYILLLLFMFYFFELQHTFLIS